MTSELVLRAARALLVLEVGEADADHWMNVDRSGSLREHAIRRADVVLGVVATAPEAPAVLARALYEEQRASIPADDPLVSVVGVPWDQAPMIVHEQWTATIQPVADAARTWVRG